MGDRNCFTHKENPSWRHWRAAESHTLLKSSQNGPFKYNITSVSYLRVVRFQRRVFPQLWICVFIVNIITDANELLSAVGAGYEDYRHSHSVGLWNQTCIRSVSLLGRNKNSDSEFIVPQCKIKNLGIKNRDKLS